jgi:hypothetical protein
VAADLDVVEHRHRGEQGGRLEGTADAKRGDIGRRAAPERLAVQADVPAGLPVEPAQAIEQGSLARAVGADQSHDPALGHRESHRIERDNAAEAHGHVLDFQQ